MKHKITVMVPVEKRGFFGKKTVMEKRTVTVDSKTYKKLKAQYRNRPFSLDELIMYDVIFDDDF